MKNIDLKLVAFDLDDTLAPSKSALPAPMATALQSLLEVVPVCVISGGNFYQFESQLLQGLNADASQLNNLHLMPTCGTRYLRFQEGAWQQVYSQDLSVSQRQMTSQILESAAKELGFWEETVWGARIEDRESQITFSALGQEAPLEAKRAWDPTGEKKRALVAAVQPLLPELEARGGGSTSVDVTARGIDKAYGMRRLVEQTGIPKESMLFVGDRLDEGGNDYPVLAAGWQTRAVDDWKHTLTVIEEILAELS